LRRSSGESVEARAVSKRPVFWSDSALDDIDKSIAYIAERSPSAARAAHGAIEQ
jgi:plasmid stabilization system protein ParE